MESFVTRKEFNRACKDLTRLKRFLGETFGAKFFDFMGDGDEEEESTGEKSDSVVTAGPPNTTVMKNQEKTVGDILAKDNKKSKSSPEDPLDFKKVASPVVVPLDIPVESHSSTDIELEVYDEKPTLISVETSPCINLASDEEDEEDEMDAECEAKTILSSIPDKQSEGTQSINTGLSQKTLLPESRAVVPVKVAIANVSFPVAKKRSLTLDTESGSKLKRLGGPRSLKLGSEKKKSKPDQEDNKIMQCPECSLFVFENQLDSHMKNHALYDARRVESTSTLLTQQHKCPVCQEECANFDKYVEHLNSVHPDLQGRPCPICSKILSQKTRLKRHLITHDKLKFCCNICGKGYNRSDNLTAHFKTHEENKEAIFYCSFCNNAFASREGRDKHMSTAHSDASDTTIVTSSTSSSITPPVVAGTSQQEEIDDLLPANESVNIRGTKESEKIKLEVGTNLLSFVYEGDDD